jgi:hypothetical protein
MSKNPIRVCITGAAGQIGYALLPHICLGKTFGPDQPIILHLLDLNIEAVQTNLSGVKMELEDSTYSLLKEVICTGDAAVAFSGADFVIMLGAFPRKEGMERKDLLVCDPRHHNQFTILTSLRILQEKNCAIFQEQGKLLDTVASKSVKVFLRWHSHLHSQTLTCLNNRCLSLATQQIPIALLLLSAHQAFQKVRKEKRPALHFLSVFAHDSSDSQQHMDDLHEHVSR